MSQANGEGQRPRFEHQSLAGATFLDVNLSESNFEDVNLRSTRIHNANLSDVSISAAQMGGARFKHIGLPDGHDGGQRPVSFEGCDFQGATFLDCDLRGAAFNASKLDGVTIDGVPLADLFAAWQASKR